MNKTQELNTIMMVLAGGKEKMMGNLHPLTLVVFGPLLMVTTIRTLRPSLRRLPS